MERASRCLREASLARHRTVEPPYRRDEATEDAEQDAEEFQAELRAFSEVAAASRWPSKVCEATVQINQEQQENVVEAHSREWDAVSRRE